MERRLIDQSAAIDAIIPYITTYEAELNNPNRPLASLFLLGPTGTGKTHCVEAITEILHGDKKHMIRIDCAQFEHSHEVAKLVGSPPGYLGHKETQGMLTQGKLTSSLSNSSDISIILFDEIEKAHNNIFRHLLSIMDKGEMSMGDNSVTNFRKSLIFYTSNLGAAEMQNVMKQKFGFLAGTQTAGVNIYSKLESIGLAAVKKKFSPEFFNRLDEVITYHPLSQESIRKIFSLTFNELRARVYRKTSPKKVFLMLTEEVENILISKGFSELYGARELSRIIQRDLVQPLSDMMVDSPPDDSSVIRAEIRDGEIKFMVLENIEISKALTVIKG